MHCLEKILEIVEILRRILAKMSASDFTGSWVRDKKFSEVVIGMIGMKRVSDQRPTDHRIRHIIEKFIDRKVFRMLERKGRNVTGIN